jgi:hypothetical protein
VAELTKKTAAMKASEKEAAAPVEVSSYIIILPPFLLNYFQYPDISTG